MEKILRLLRIALRGEEKEFTSGNINRALLLLSIPMILEMLMESLFVVVDVYFVSKVGINAVATIGLTESVITLIYSIAFGLSMAATAMVARRVGENDQKAASKAGTQAIIIAVALGLVIGIFGIIYAETILKLMGGEPELIKEGVEYTRLMLGTNVVILLLFLLNGIFRGAGDASIAMKSLWLANGINIVLDPLLIFGIGPFPELGLKGAAIATIIGRSSGVLYQLWTMFGKSSVIKLYPELFKIDWNIIGRLSNVAATGAGQFLIASASWIFLMRIIAVFGSEAVAGYTIGIRVIVFTILPSMGIANAAATLVGQNLGAKQPLRAENSVKRAAILNVAFMLAVSFIYLLFTTPIIRFFNSDPEVIDAGVITLRILSIGYAIFGYAMIIGHAFNGAGDTRTPTWVNFFCFWMVEIPLGYFLAVKIGMEISGVCWAIVIAESLMAFMLGYLFQLGKWKTVQL